MCNLPNFDFVFIMVIINAVIYVGFSFEIICILLMAINYIILQGCGFVAK